MMKILIILALFISLFGIFRFCDLLTDQFCSDWNIRRKSTAYYIVDMIIFLIIYLTFRIPIISLVRDILKSIC